MIRCLNYLKRVRDGKKKYGGSAMCDNVSLSTVDTDYTDLNYGSIELTDLLPSNDLLC